MRRLNRKNMNNPVWWCHLAFLVLCSLPRCSISFSQAPQSPKAFYASNTQNLPRRTELRRRLSTSLFGRLWNNLQVEEDDEPAWYLLNCVAGLELDLLAQCIATCADMESAEKFLVPTETHIRSHGANRMVSDTKVKYPGYVFAKVRLCEEAYEAIQGLDLCRSWMGTIKYKGLKRLPPRPAQLSEEEIEKYGLEEMEEENPWDVDEYENPNIDIIVDSEEADKKEKALEREIEEHTNRVYGDLRVNDQVMVTAACKYYGENGTVRRLKGGNIFVRFDTYGTVFEDWLKPEDVRKLTEAEIIRGSRKPTKPITQYDLDRPQRTERFSRRNTLQRSGERKRRQDRRFQSDMTEGERQQNSENFDWYKESRRSNDNTFSDDEWTMRGTQKNSNDKSDWYSDMDSGSKWRKPSQRQERRERNRRRESNEGRRVASAIDGDDDWSAFIAPSTPKKQQGARDDADDFFASLMKDLSKGQQDDSPSARSDNSRSNRRDSKPDYTDEDDFFASLINEISDELPESKSPGKKTRGESTKAATDASDDPDDFFASLQAELDSSLNEKIPSTKKASDASTSTKEDSSDGDDLFDNFLDDASDNSQNDADDDFWGDKEPRKADSRSKDTSSSWYDDDDSAEETSSKDTSSSWYDDEGPEQVSSKDTSSSSSWYDDDGSAKEGDRDDFFSSLSEEIDADLKKASKKSPEKSSQEVEMNAVAEKPPKSSSGSSPDLTKLTIPALKEMLRERGLKVSGKKAELIERLS